MQIQNRNVHATRTMRRAISRHENFRFATVSRDRPTTGKIDTCVSLQRRAIQNFEMHVLPQRRAQKCMQQVSDVQDTSPHTKFGISPQFWTSDTHEVTKGSPVEIKKLHFTTVLEVRQSLFVLRVARRPAKFAFHHSFKRLTITFFALRVASASSRICILPQFWRPTITFCVKGRSASSRICHVLGVRRSLFALRVARRAQEFAFHHSFGRPMSTK